uniref:Uncharacterized protein n=1 Tax=Magallana gigas TaxID=29159 RepID=K1RGM8_MAGGI
MLKRAWPLRYSLLNSWNKATSKPFVPGCSPSVSGRRRTSVCVLGATCATCVHGPLLFSPVLDIGISVPCGKPSTKESELKKTEGLERELERRITAEHQSTI